MESILTNFKAPLWLMFPSYSRYSLGWRMGVGESYQAEFWGWHDALSEQNQQTYQQWFPSPKTWIEIYN